MDTIKKGSSGFCVLLCLLGALPPSPRHLSLWASSMVERVGVSPVDGTDYRNAGFAAGTAGLWRRAPRAPQQSGGMGDAIGRGGIALLLSCCRRRAKHARGPGASVAGRCLLSIQKHAKTGWARFICTAAVFSAIVVGSFAHMLAPGQAVRWPRKEVRKRREDSPLHTCFICGIAAAVSRVLRPDERPGPPDAENGGSTPGSRPGVPIVVRNTV